MKNTSGTREPCGLNKNMFNRIPWPLKQLLERPANLATGGAADAAVSKLVDPLEVVVVVMVVTLQQLVLHPKGHRELILDQGHVVELPLLPGPGENGADQRGLPAPQEPRYHRDGNLARHGETDKEETAHHKQQRRRQSHSSTPARLAPGCQWSQEHFSLKNMGQAAREG